MESIRKNAILNVIRQICSVIFPLITFPYAVRILQPEGYGIFTFSSSVISYVALFAALGISSYAVREGSGLRGDHASFSVFSNEVFTVNIFSTLTAYALLILAVLIWPKLQPYKSVLFILSLSVLFTTLGTDWINVIFEDYAYTTVRYILCHILGIVLLFVLVRDRSDLLNYTFVSVIGTACANAANIFYIRKKHGIKLKPVITPGVKKHILPVLILFANTIATTIYINSDSTILGILRGDYEVGIYGVATQIYFIVKQIINAAILVIVPRASAMIAANDIDTLNYLYKKTFGGVLVITVPCMVGLICLSPEIIMLISGSEYAASAVPLAILSASLLFATSACFYINGVLIPYKKERQVLILTAFSALLNIILNIILIPYYGCAAAASTTLLSELIMFAGGLLLSRSLIEIDIKRDIILSAVSGAAVLAVCLSVGLVTGNYILKIVLSILFSAVIYLIILFRAKNNIVWDTAVSFYNRLKKNVH